MLVRYAATLAIAAFITLGLFFVMHTLVLEREGELDEAINRRVIDFVKLKKESETELRKRRLPKKQQQDDQPPPPDLNLSNTPMPSGGTLALAGPSIDMAVDLAGGPNVGAVADAEAILVYGVQPIYPERAASRGLEGWVHLGFTVTPTGSVKDEYVIASSSKIFNRAAMKAIRKFKYKPKIVDGTAVDWPDQEFLMSFEMAD